ncbi:polysaccharide biosynthesis protein [Actibacterium pelagium]|uniref:Polysaccharide biosynthesis protein CapD-like domain-containing protein n=1 Tax=Actibacterium pelagium TaxID=2029103 RepID=A0A917AIL4_9RHOB|nr:polysaccharide biosynthesis protein [Actibacterium pelagium]GGE54578.1 hypothetical protein GCM10011517_22760 [Actibacterium pelagium]
MTRKGQETMQKFRRTTRPEEKDDPQNQGTSPEGLSFFKDRSVLISGAGGTVGTELCRQLLTHSPARLILVERSELNLSNLLQEIQPDAQKAEISLHPALECVLRKDRMRHLMTSNGVSVVLHAAAYKHVPVVEMHPISGIENNLFGTLSLAEAAVDAQVEKFLLVSTDKAIAPKGMLGASKLLAEQAIWDLCNRSPKTMFSAVRFGNVYGSSGSAIPIWQKQVAQGGPITLTDPKATRYFMSLDEATRLVLQSAVLSAGRDLFALDMGPARSILSLAKDVMAQAGRPDLPITFTGLRPGERLHEPAPVSSCMGQTLHPRILRAKPEPLLPGDIRLLLRSLSAAVSENDPAAIQRLIDQWVFSKPVSGRRRQG